MGSLDVESMTKKSLNHDLVMEKLERINDHIEYIKDIQGQRLQLIENHLKTLNGQTEKNTAFRNQQKTLNWLIFLIIAALVGLIIKNFGG